MANKIDSNVTGLRYAEEASLKTLPGSPIFYPLEPNTYSDFGGQITTVARNPINPSRQRKKGGTTDLEASGGFNQDLTFTNSTRLLQGFFFADIREKTTTQPLNGAAVVLASATGSSKTYGAASGLTGFQASSLIFASGFALSANNGLKTLASNSTTTSIVVVEALADETPPATAKIEKIGHQFASGDATITVSSGVPFLNSATVNFTTLGLIPGEWIYLGGDTANSKFANNGGWARIATIAAGSLTFDKTSWNAVADPGSGKTIQMFFGNVLRNEYDATLIKRRSYHLERTLGSDANGVMSEYLVGAVPNELTVNIPSAEKVNIDMSFVALDNEQRTGTQGVKPGTRPTIASEAFFNTSVDFTRIKLSLASGVNPTPLFAFATELTLTVNNNVTPDKAIGVLGAFDTTAGTFEVGGNLTVYFADVTAVQAVRNNSDVTLDIIMAKKNKALLFDLPLITLGDGRLNITQDTSITLPLETMAAESKFGHTLMFQTFPYLPDIAGGV